MDELIARLDAFQADDGDARRVFHGRGHCYPGLEAVNLDYLPPLLLLTCYAEPTDLWLNHLVERTRRIAGIRALLVQYRCRPGAPLECLWGEWSDAFDVEEDGLRFQLVLGANQNIGFFLDMAEGRRWVRAHAQGKRVLNLFAYTCAFSVAAVAGGAEQVVNLDMSSGALNRGRGNHRLNSHDLRRVRFLSHDLFRSWGKLRKLGPFDLIIADPPSFQKGSFMVEKDYPRVIARLPELLSEEGEVLLALNDPGRSCAFLHSAVAERAPELVFQSRLDNPAVFEETDSERSLKVLHYRRGTKTASD